MAWAAGWPMHTGNFAPDPHPAASYEAALDRVAAEWKYEDERVSPRGRTLLLTRGGRTNVVYVLLHGLTASPAQFAALADSLFDSGANVYVPRLPHHAERNGDARILKRINADGLRRFGDSVADVAAGLGDTVVVVGISAGGTVAAWMGEHRAEVFRVVLIAPALAPQVFSGKKQTVLMRLTARAPNITRQSPPDTARPDRNPGYATHALVEMFRLGASVRETAARQPPTAREFVTLLNENDRSVSWDAAVETSRNWEKSGAATRVYAFPKGLRYPHNVWDPNDGSTDPAIVFPVVFGLARGEAPGQAVRHILPVLAHRD